MAFQQIYVFVLKYIFTYFANYYATNTFQVSILILIFV